MTEYEKHENFSKLILRDKLAIERTRMANVRTFLAFARTAIALFGGGLALVKIIDVPSFIAIGWIFMIASPIVLLAGIVNYNETARRVSAQICESMENL